MPRNVTVTFDDGSKHVYQGVPDDATPDVVEARASKEFGKRVSALDGGRAAKPDAFAGDDLLSNEAMRKLSAGAQSTVTPSPDRSSVAKYLGNVKNALTEPIEQTQVDKVPLVGPLVGAGEAGLSMATGMLDPITSPLFHGGEVGAGTYQPRTGGGKALMNVMGAVAAPITESGAGDALLPLAPELQGLSTVKRAPRVPKEVPEPIPTTQALKEAKNKAYAQAKEADISVPAESYSQAVEKIRNVVTDEGIDPTLHPKSTAVMRRLDQAEGQPLSLQQAETLRKIALDAEDDMNPVTRAPTPDARIAGKIVDELDDQIDALSLNSEARALNARYRRSDMIDRMIKRAEIRAGANYTQAGMEHALRREFKDLAVNDRRMRFFTPEQRAAIEKVAKGGNMENSLRNIGKFDPTTGGMSAFMSALLAGGGAVPTGGASLLLPAAGYGAKRLATRMTAANVEKAREALVGRGLKEPAAIQTKAERLGRAMGGEMQPANASLAQALMRKPPRPVSLIQADLDRLDAKAQRLPMDESFDSPRAQAIAREYERLTAELKAAAGQRPSGSSGAAVSDSN